MSNSIKVKSPIILPKVNGNIFRTQKVSAPINRVIKVTSDMSVPVFPVPLPAVIDFTGGDQVFANDTFVPSSGTKLKAYKGGAGVIEQLSDVGKTTTAVTADNAFFGAQNSMTGAWKVSWDWSYDSPVSASFNFQTVAIMNSLHTVKFDPDLTDVIVAFLADRFNGTSANVRMQYRNTSDATVQLFQISGGLPFGTLIGFSIDKGVTTPGLYTFIFDTGSALGSPVVKTIAISSVIASGVNGFFHANDPYATAAFTHHATMRIDNIAGLV